MVSHVPKMMERHAHIKQVSGQGEELVPSLSMVSFFLVLCTASILHSIWDMDEQQNNFITAVHLGHMRVDWIPLAFCILSLAIAWFLFFLPLAAAIEKKNADCKGFYFSSSKRSGPFEILETCERLHSMEQSKLSSGASVVREKRHYDSTKRRSGQGNSDEPPCQLPWSSWRLQHQYPYISILAL